VPTYKQFIVLGKIIAVTAYQIVLHQ